MQFFQTEIPDFPGPLLVRDVLTDGGNVPISFRRLAGQQFPRLLVNLPVPLGKLFNQFRRDTFDLKIAARFVFNLITKLHQFAGQFMVIDILDKLLGGEHLMVLQCLPLLLDRIKRGVEHDAMTVQVRVQRAGGIVPEHGRHQVARMSGQCIGSSFRTRVAAKVCS